MKPSKKASERSQLDQFRKAYRDFPDGLVQNDDRQEDPDCIVNGSRKIGIEITGFDRIDGGRSDSERQQRLRREGVTQKAQIIYLEGGGKGIELIFGFQQISSSRRKELPAELAAFAKRIENKVRETIILAYDAAPGEVTFAWNSGGHDDATWAVQQVNTVRLMARDRLEEIVRTKDEKPLDTKNAMLTGC